MKRTGWPTLHMPMSDSDTSAETCILVRSCAIVKSVGAWNDAATLCPTSYCAVHDDAVDRRDDLAVLQVRLRLLEGRLRLRDRGLRGVEVGLGLIEVGLRARGPAASSAVCRRSEISELRASTFAFSSAAWLCATFAWNGVGIELGEQARPSSLPC